MSWILRRFHEYIADRRAEQYLAEVITGMLETNEFEEGGKEAMIRLRTKLKKGQV